MFLFSCFFISLVLLTWLLEISKVDIVVNDEKKEMFSQAWMNRVEMKAVLEAIS